MIKSSSGLKKTDMSYYMLRAYLDLRRISHVKKQITFCDTMLLFSHC